MYNTLRGFVSNSLNYIFDMGVDGVGMEERWKWDFSVNLLIILFPFPFIDIPS